MYKYRGTANYNKVFALLLSQCCLVISEVRFCCFVLMAFQKFLLSNVGTSGTPIQILNTYTTSRKLSPFIGTAKAWKFLLLFEEKAKQVKKCNNEHTSHLQCVRLPQGVLLLISFPFSVLREISSISCSQSSSRGT